jgi:hypothetical protein
MPNLTLRAGLVAVLAIAALGLLAGCSDDGPTTAAPQSAWTVTDPLADVLKSTDGHTPPAPEDRVARLAEILGLTDEQAAAFLDACTAFFDGVAALRDQVQAGELTHDEAHVQADALRAEFEAALQTILTPEQYDMLAEMRMQRDPHHDRPPHDAPPRPDLMAHWTEWLTAVEATQDQVDAVMAGLETMRTGLDEVRAAVRAGEMTFEEATAAVEQLRADFDALLQETLTEDQYAALLEMRPDCDGRHR